MDILLPAFLAAIVTIAVLSYQISKLRKENLYYVTELRKENLYYVTELQDFQELLQLRNKKLEQQILQLMHWANEELPEQLVTILFQDITVLELKDKILIKDEDFYTSFQNPLIKIQQLITQHVNTFYQEYTFKTIQGIKEKINAEFS